MWEGGGGEGEAAPPHQNPTISPRHRRKNWACAKGELQTHQLSAASILRSTRQNVRFSFGSQKEF